MLTITARLGHGTGYEHPQPTLRPLELPVLPMFPGGRPAEFPELHANAPMRLRGEHIRPGAWLVVDGRRVEGSVRCETGTLPDCEDDIAVVRLARLPADAGLHLLQVQNPHGLFSNDFVFHVVDEPPRPESGNRISSGGTFDGRGAWRVGLTNASVTWNGRGRLHHRRAVAAALARAALARRVDPQGRRVLSLLLGPGRRHPLHRDQRRHRGRRTTAASSAPASTPRSAPPPAAPGPA